MAYCSECLVWPSIESDNVSIHRLNEDYILPYKVLLIDHDLHHNTTKQDSSVTVSRSKIMASILCNTEYNSRTANCQSTCTLIVTMMIKPRAQILWRRGCFCDLIVSRVFM